MNNGCLRPFRDLLTVPISNGGRPAVNDEHLSGDERRFVRSQVQRHSADFVRTAHAREWLSGFELLEVVFVLPEIFAEIGLDQPWRNGVDADVVTTEFNRPTTGH